MDIVIFKSQDSIKKAARCIYSSQRARILERIPYAEVHHVGSTSFPNAITKGDLDLNVRVEKDKFREAAKGLSSLYEKNQVSNWTRTFASFKDDKNFQIPFGVQLTAIGSQDDNFLIIRDVLRNNEKLVSELNNLKRSFNGRSMTRYRNAKSVFFEVLLKNESIHRQP